MSEYLNSAQADGFIGKGTNYLNVIRCKDKKRVEIGLVPKGPPYYKEPGESNSTHAVLYKKEDLIEWMVNKKVKGMVKHSACSSIG